MTATHGQTGERDAGASERAEISALSFEEALERLEQIVAELRSPNVPLERAFELWEEGRKLHAHCNQILESMRRRLEQARSEESGDNLELEEAAD
jgi:exodeoxyribonuclease VII small subunit